MQVGIWGSCFIQAGSPFKYWQLKIYTICTLKKKEKEPLHYAKKMNAQQADSRWIKKNTEATDLYEVLWRKAWQSEMHTRLTFLSDLFPSSSIIFSPTKKSFLRSLPFYHHRASFNMSADRHSIISLFMYSTFYSESHVNEECHYQP